MAGETELADVLASLRITQRDEPVTVITTHAPVDVGHGIAAVIVEAEGNTVIVSVAEAARRGWPIEFVAAWLTVEAHTSLEAVGLTAAVSAVLASRGIACNMLAGYHHDHILVPFERAADAVAALEGLTR